MKTVILAGGLGTRISEETSSRPKPMVEIGGKPILWHIMNIYSAYGFNDFVICLGYRGYMIKEYFSNYLLHTADVTFDMRANSMEVHSRYCEPWRVTLVDTGPETMTGGRLKRVASYLKDETHFGFTYGDGVGNIDVAALQKFHLGHGRLASVTSVQPAGRFGAMRMSGSRVTAFQEKPEDEGGWINGGFFVLSPKVIDFIDGDATSWEKSPLEQLAHMGELQAFRHDGFWQPMDTLRDKVQLEKLWAEGQAPWRVW